ncbi:hypothetical protein C5L30_000635 [Companilactobacillus farciminis]|uniref:HTH cro/C1-type domain-containing protein n=1 Tax=Companilactobacillus farciminis TaxID=1612 RepID=A0A4R5NG36_9LACO|nr:helix-turn-helix transcriptional regulator [Companilactobacillus farciminis]ATO45985.1 hypothetical protein LF20184_04100 [Companilactobacillus farciminis KCTC 3681 = DSM 20184]TDG73199.1 hypothetical protein C5L30_000635 [Companilactobacillus farciminis]
MATYIKDKNKLNEILIINGLTQQDLASKVGISRSYMSSIANGHKPVGTRTSKRICEVLNVKYKDIFVLTSSTKVLQK